MNPQENTLKKKALGKGFQKYSKLVIAAVLIVVLFAVGEIVVKNTTGGTFASLDVYKRQGIDRMGIGYRSTPEVLGTTIEEVRKQK